MQIFEIQYSQQDKANVTVDEDIYHVVNNLLCLKENYPE